MSFNLTDTGLFKETRPGLSCQGMDATHHGQAPYTCEVRYLGDNLLVKELLSPFMQGHLGSSVNTAWDVPLRFLMRAVEIIDDAAAAAQTPELSS